MTVTELQRVIGTTADGRWGPVSRAALLAYFTNRTAHGITTGELDAFAARLGCSMRQIAAVGNVESRGTGYDALGRPKILFERHVYHRLTNGRFSDNYPWISNATPGGYKGGTAEYDRLGDAVGLDPDAAFASASWGAFQIMGFHAAALGYASAFDMAASCRSGMVAHYELLCRFIEKNGLADELRALSARPEDCRAFARAYNGPKFEVNSYHTKLAEQMR
jgi:hypothetical protein